jgi:TolB protein
VARVVSADLERSGLFAPMDPKAFIQDSASLQQSVRFQDWKLINAQALVTGAATKLPMAGSASSSGSGTCSAARR